MQKDISISILKFLLSLSEGIELVSSDLKKHQLRATYIAWKIAEEIGVSVRVTQDLVFAGLVHDIGALSPEEKIDLRESRYKDIDIHCKLGENILKKVKQFEKI